MKKTLKIFFSIIFLLFILGLITWLVLQQGWEWWTGLALFFAVLGIWLGFILFRKFLAKRKMQEFVARVVDQEISYIDSNSKARDTTTLQSLKKRWQEAISLIKLSKTKDIPWFIMLGGTESGKTSAIKNSKLNTALSSIVKNLGISKTENCEWWFLEKSIILDTTSRYVVPENEYHDSEEWKEFLNLFIKYRKRKSVNGIIVTISAERLLNNDALSLNDEGQNIRKRIDNLMRVCWAKIPVYVMITQVDKVFGFNEFFKSLDANEVTQAAGFLNNNHKSWEPAIDDFFAITADKLSQLRTKQVDKLIGPPQPGLLMFPQEFMKLKAAFLDFVQPIFANNAYQEQPLCRGIYISSSRQDSGAHSTIVNYNGANISSPATNEPSRGIFLHDFFGKVLPSDKQPLNSAYNSLRLRYLAVSLGVLSILSVAIAIACLMTAAYVHNRNVMNSFSSVYKTIPSMTTDTAANLVTLDGFRQNIEKLDKMEDEWFLPSFGMTDSKDLIQKLKSQYVIMYNKGFLAAFDKQLYDRITQLNKSASPDEISLYIEFLTARIGNINNVLTNGKPENIATSARNLQFVFPNVVTRFYPQMPLAVSNVTSSTYIAYLEWNEDKAPIRRNLKAMLSSLRNLLMNDPDWHLLKNQRAFIPYNIKLSDFWEGMGNNDGSIVIPGMFTKEGMTQIKKFLALVTEAGVPQNENGAALQEFWSWYQTQYYQAWHNFIIAFNQVDFSTLNNDQKKNLALSMIAESNTYYQFLSKAAYELAPDPHLANQPDWAKLIIQLNDLQTLSSGESTIISLQQRVYQGVTKLVNDNSISKKSAYFNHQIMVANLLSDYNSVLAQITPDLISDDSYLRYIGEAFSEYNGSADQKSPVILAVLKFRQLQQAMSANISSDTQNIWKIEAGPLNFLLKYLMERTSCAIDNKWGNEVIGKISMVRNNDALKALLDKNTGLLWKFADNTLAPYLSLDTWGYSAKTIFAGSVFAQSIDFNSGFMSFINNIRPAMADYQDQYTVKIATVPVTVNSDAEIKPYGTILSVQCADGEQFLKNYNYPNQATINWSPDKCGDTTLTIIFPNLTLTKVYPGGMGFANFLLDFKDGAHQFDSDEFAESKVLEGTYQVDWVKVKYKIEQNIPAIGLLKNINSSLPQKITNCAQ